MVNITRIKQEVLGVMTLDKDYWPHYTKFKTSTTNIESSGVSEQNLLAIFNGTLNFFLILKLDISLPRGVILVIALSF